MAERDRVDTSLDKIRVKISEVVDENGEIGTLPSEAEILCAMAEAGWSSDPGTGQAIILPDGREVLNPVPLAPPVEYSAEMKFMDAFEQKLFARKKILEDSEVIETEADLNDFDVPDPEDYWVESIYEVEMVPEVPAIPREAPQVAPSGSDEVKPNGDVQS